MTKRQENIKLLKDEIQKEYTKIYNKKYKNAGVYTKLKIKIFGIHTPYLEKLRESLRVYRSH